MTTGPAPAMPRNRWKKPLIAVTVLLTLGLGSVAGCAAWLVHKMDGNLTRADGALDRSGIPGERPAADPAAGKALNILLVGSDSRGAQSTGSDATTDFEAQRGNRTDTMMLLNIPEDRKSTRAVSLPRDSWVPIPGHGEAKLNAAFSWGGPKLLVATVEDLTGVRIDHYMAVDFNGFKGMVDSLGGVEVTLKTATHDPSQNVDFAAGVNRLNGDRALQFVRQRHGLARGDLDRVARQQQLLKAVAGQVTAGGVLSSPLKTRDLLDSMTKSLTVDDRLGVTDLMGLANSLRSVKQSDMEFRTVPVASFGTRQGQSVVLLDSGRSRELFDAVRTGGVWPEPLKGEGL